MPWNLLRRDSSPAPGQPDLPTLIRASREPKPTQDELLRRLPHMTADEQKRVALECWRGIARWYARVLVDVTIFDKGPAHLLGMQRQTAIQQALSKSMLLEKLLAVRDEHAATLGMEPEAFTSEIARRFPDSSKLRRVLEPHLRRLDEDNYRAQIHAAHADVERLFDRGRT